MDIGGILSGFAQAGHEHQQRLFDMAVQQKNQLASAYSRLMQDESYPEEARQQFSQAFNDIVTADPFKLPQTIKKYQDMKITVQPKNTTSAPSLDVGLPAGGVTPLGMPGSIPAPQPPAETRSLMAPMPFEERLQREGAESQAKALGQLGITQWKAGEWKKQTDFARDMPDGKRHKFVREVRVNPDTGQQDYREVDLGDIANFAPRMGDVVTLQDAKTNRDNGFFDFKDINGKNLDIDGMIQAFGPYAVIRNKGAYYEPATPKMEFKTFNNQVNAVSPYAPSAPPTVMGTAIPPKTSERPMQIPNEEGGRSIVTPTATTTVQTGSVGAPAPPAGVAPVGPSVAAPVATPAPSRAPLSTTTPTPPPTQKTPPPDELTGKLPMPKGAKLKPVPIEGSMNPGEYTRQAKIVTSIHPALNTLMGDPENPSFKGMESFAYLVEDPAASDRLGTAARLIIHEMADTSDGGGGLGATILGTGVSLGGGLIKALENKFGATAWKASTSGKVIDKAMDGLTPDERQFLDRIIGAYGTVVGLRAVTSGSALQFNTRLMEKELPIPGISGAITKRQFYDKLATLAGEPLGSTKTFRPSIFTDRDYYMKKVQVFTGLGNGWRKATGPKGEVIFQHEDGKLYDLNGNPIP